MNAVSPPLLGKYVKHIDTRQIIEWLSYDPDTELLLVRWPTGSLLLLHRRGVTRITMTEEQHFLQSGLIHF